MSQTRSPIKFSRRRFIKTVTIGSGALLIGTGLTGCARGEFLHGVASGDPLQDSVVLWTRVTPGGVLAEEIPVIWVVAKDKNFQKIVGKGIEKTDSSRDFTLKLDVKGLQPGKTYYYKFMANGSESPIGRTKTLPAGRDVESFKLAVLSCSNYPAGYFHVYGEVAERNDLDAVLHLGDYLYEYGQGGYASEDAEALGRVPLPRNEILDLDDYRTRYAQYRGDRQLQAAHQNHPFICVWDDHEIANDAWLDGAENHDEISEGNWSERKEQAIQAYYEWLPVREPEAGVSYREKLYRRFTVGNLLDLYMLDTRVIGRDKQLAYENYIDPTTGSFDATRFQQDMADPNRSLLGLEQLAWLQQQMASSSTTWQVLGQQVLSGRMYLPSPLVTFQVSFAEYQQLAYLAQTNPAALTAEQLAILQAPSIPYNLDAWDGYAVEREILFQTSQALDKNLVVLAGDTHNAWANNLSTLDGTAVGVEFATPSVSSPGFEEYFPDQDPDVLAAGVVQLIPGLHYANLQHRGYMVVSFRSDICEAEYSFIDSVKSRQYEILFDRDESLHTLPGTENRKIIAG